MKIRPLVVIVLAVAAASCSSDTVGQSASSPPITYVKASNAREGDQFGAAVAISSDGTTLAVGAPLENSASTGVNGDQANSAAEDAGAVYVYTRAGDTWAQQAYIKASNAEAFDQFGNAVALSADGNTLAVAASFESSGATGINGNQLDNSRPQAGAVYVFTRTGGTWSQQAYVKASNTGEPDDGDTFGYSVALSDDATTLAVGAPSEDSSATGVNGNQADNAAAGAGAVYVFTRTANSWSQQAYVKAANTHAAMLFGYSVGLSGDGATLTAGSFDERGCSNAINGPYEMKCGGTGAVYAFTRSGSAWSQQAYLKAREQDRGDSMGGAITISDDGNTIVTGAADEDSLTTGVDAVRSGDSGEVGAPDDRSSGAGYAFVRSGGTWSQQASFKASNTGTTDWFGMRLALSGDSGTLVISAPNEDSASSGIDGKQDDDSAEQAGAAYVFTRTGDKWSPQAYVKASNAQGFDEFGSAVAVSRDGRTIVVGAHFEDSGTTGINGNQADNTATDAGAVYLFSR
jgi:hypothetical protein